jgi:hypothetical protein
MQVYQSLSRDSQLFASFLEKRFLNAYDSNSFETLTTKLLTLNVVVEWLKLLLHILDVPASNIGPDTGYPD